jgi:hypothetical protein
MGVRCVGRLVTLRRRVLILVAVALATFLLSTSSAAAYVLHPYGYQSQRIPIDRVTYVAYAYLSPAASAASSWTNAGVGITITSPGTNRLRTGYYANEWYGHTAMILGGVPPHSGTSFTIYINTRKCDSLSASGKQSVIAHELGHTIGLDEGNVSGSLMDQNRNRNTIYLPQPDDKRGAIASWMR